MFILRVWIQRIPGMQSDTDTILLKKNIRTIVSCKRKINSFKKLYGETVYAEIKQFQWHTKHCDFEVVGQYSYTFGWKGLLHPKNYKHCTHR